MASSADNESGAMQPTPAPRAARRRSSKTVTASADTAATTTAASAQPLNPAVESVSVFFPCYNDEHTIADMVIKAEKALIECNVDFEIIVVNDGSSDGSAKVLDELQASHPKLRVVTHSPNRGYGGALKSGFASAIKQWVFYTDGDGQYDPSELTKLIELARTDVDVVQGFKIGRSDSMMRKVVGRVYHHGVALAFNLSVDDVDCDFRLIRRSKLNEFTLVNTSGAICMELCRKLQNAEARWVQVGVHHYDREFGESQFFTPKRVIKTLWDLARMWVQLFPMAALQQRRERKAQRG
jgi:glycosyltransferase involved in cell wall biosynthesis